MTKNQKIWFSVFLAMFLIPEILWNNYIILIFYWIINALTGFSSAQIYNFHLIPLPESQTLTGIISFIELLGFGLSYFFIIQFQLLRKNYIKIPVILMGGFLLIFFIYLFLATISAGPQIG